MKPASAQLLALLATNQFVMADLFTFTLVNGAVLRYTTADVNIVSGGNTFLANGPLLERARAHWKIGMDVDTQDLSVCPRATDLVSGVPFLQAVKQGYFDGAIGQIERAFMATMGDTTAGTVVTFAGRVGPVDFGRTMAIFHLHSHLELLNRNMPILLYQPGCVHTLYDAGCLAVKASFSLNVTIGAGPTLSAIPVPGTGQADGYYDLGQLAFTSGANAGWTKAIKSWAGGVATLVSPLLQLPAPGDAVTISAGCDKQQATCQTKFNNLLHFLGAPYVPVPETAI